MFEVFQFHFFCIKVLVIVIFLTAVEQIIMIAYAIVIFTALAGLLYWNVQPSSISLKSTPKNASPTTKQRLDGSKAPYDSLKSSLKATVSQSNITTSESPKSSAESKKEKQSIAPVPIENLKKAESIADEKAEKGEKTEKIDKADVVEKFTDIAPMKNRVKKNAKPIRSEGDFEEGRGKKNAKSMGSEDDLEEGKKRKKNKRMKSEGDLEEGRAFKSGSSKGSRKKSLRPNKSVDREEE
jgi:hypothetical protein